MAIRHQVDLGGHVVDAVQHKVGLTTEKGVGIVLVKELDANVNLRLREDAVKVFSHRDDFGRANVLTRCHRMSIQRGKRDLIEIDEPKFAHPCTE